MDKGGKLGLEIIPIESMPKIGPTAARRFTSDFVRVGVWRAKRRHERRSFRSNMARVCEIALREEEMG
jgi:hypothetical protein